MKARLLAALCGALAASCAARESDADLYLQAQDPALSTSQALALCGALSSADDADECRAGAVRARSDATPEHCAAILSEDWRNECHFALAELLATRGERWDALHSCGLAGRFMNECLYHVWTRELQNLALSGAALASALDKAREVVAFYAQVETAGPQQDERVWNDFWFFWHLHHKPAQLEICQDLEPGDAERCTAGTVAFAARATYDTLRCEQQDCRLLDRSCRAGEVPDFVLAPLFTADPTLLAAADASLQSLCEDGKDAPRPWNPIFSQRRPR